jgi:UDP-N-acetylmuramyl pentapeptide phosphotransferase/UDP-N-acetylglucosamine-1-phosphate transferase
VNVQQLTHLPDLPPAVWVAGLVAFLVAVLLTITKHLHGHLTMDGLAGVQKMHAVPTPRVGGIALFSGVFAGWLFGATEPSALLGGILVAGLPAFVFGLAEDITKRVGVAARLAATMASGFIGWAITGVALSRVDVPFLDPLMGNIVVGVAVTAFAVAGIANAVNIIDGFNGLASGFVATASVGLTILAILAGDPTLAVASLTISAAITGFWLMNWPFGKIFLGDGGSYFAGFALAWLCVLLVERNANVTAFAGLLVCIHPVTEVLFSIFRRRMSRSSPGAPDARHLHTLVMRRIVAPRLRRLYKGDIGLVFKVQNPLTGLLLASMSLPPVLLSLFVWDRPAYAAISCIGFALGYITLYARLVRFHWCSPVTFLFVKPRRIILGR